MQRLAQFDVTRQFKRPASRLAAQILFGMVCALAMIGVRTLLNVVAPLSGPFALVYPTVLIATLFGHWRAGLVALFVSFGWAWYFVLGPSLAFGFLDPTDPARVVINFLSCCIVLVFAEAFRRAVEVNARRAEVELARRKLLMADLEHRTKNNFQLVASLLAIQKRRDATPGIADALDMAIGRINTFSDAYSTLTLGHGEDAGDEGGEVDMVDYLTRLTERLGRASLPDTVDLKLEIAPLALPREKAVAIGLFANEALTNCAKYAFVDGRAGSVTVRMTPDADGGWALEIVDDGMGKSNGAPAGEGLGSNLFAAFAQQADADHAIDIGERGARVSMASRRAEPTIN